MTKNYNSKQEKKLIETKLNNQLQKSKKNKKMKVKTEKKKTDILQNHLQPG